MLLEALKKVPGIVGHIYALLVIYFGWVLFKFEDFAALGTAFKGMFGLNGNSFTDLQVGLTFRNNIFFLIFAVLAVTPIFMVIRRAVIKWYKQKEAIPYLVYGYEIAAPVVMLILSTMALVGNSYNPFLYFQF